MASDNETRKKRYLDEIIWQMSENPELYLDLDSPSERRGRSGKPRPSVAIRYGRFGPAPGPSEAQKAFTAGLSDGFTFGAGDEISAGLAAVPAWFDDRDAGILYDEELKRIRAEAAYLQQQHPNVYLVGEVVGSIAQPVNYTGAGWAARGVGLAGRVSRSAALGGANGATRGFMSGSGGVENRLESAGRGAIKGALIGAALGVPLHGYKTGREFSLGPNFRIAPFGNRTNHPLGRFPHYHRRGPTGPNGRTVDGQGIGRHRPWETKVDTKGRPLDKSFLDRF